MKKILSVLLVVALLTTMTFVFAGCEAGERKEQGKKVDKVGFIYVGPVGDGGWTYAHHQGGLYLKEKLGVEIVIQESVEEGPKSAEAMKNMIDDGCNVIFATSYGFMKYAKEVAEEYPDVTILHCSGKETADNMNNYFGRMYEPRYLSGIIAGMKTKSNKIGYVAAFPITEVIRGINAFTLGVRSVNPDATVEVVWTNTWYNPVDEKNAAIALLDTGADVITQHQDTAAPQQAAEEKGAFAIGYNTDSQNLAPKAYLTAPIWNWGPYYVEQVEKIQNGTWKNTPYWGGLKDGIVNLAPMTDLVPDNAKAKVEEVRKTIEDGTFFVFQGPIKAQDGTVMVPEGSKMTDAEMLSIDYNWFVEGVIGTIPAN